MTAFFTIAAGIAFMVAVAALIAWATGYEDDLD